VVSVTSIHGGTAFNIIPPEVTLEGTIRTFDAGVRQKVLERFRQVVQGTGEAMGCKAEINLKRITPALINHPSISEKVQETSRRIMPDSDLSTANQITMGAEDAAFLLEKVDGCFFFVGSASRERHLDYGHHHPKFDFDEAALLKGAALMASAAADILK
jgi:amidohydrolase